MLFWGCQRLFCMLGLNILVLGLGAAAVAVDQEVTPPGLLRVRRIFGFEIYHQYGITALPSADDPTYIRNTLPNLYVGMLHHFPLTVW